MSLITTINPVTGATSEVESNDGEVVHGVNASGESLGLVARGTEFAVVPEKPPGPGWKWNFGTERWVHTDTLADAILAALTDVDASAGSARLRYITDVPGQQATYVVKQGEAEKYLASGGIPGPYLAAEAAAMGATATQAAQLITGIAAQWNGVFGPAIEGARRVGKISIAAATTNAEVTTRRNAAIAALNGI